MVDKFQDIRRRLSRTAWRRAHVRIMRRLNCLTSMVAVCAAEITCMLVKSPLRAPVRGERGMVPHVIHQVILAVF
jgi:hypothetical protein